jgi:UDP-glucuronate 4-epimerase
MILVTGAAGFVGFHVALRLLRDGQIVHGLDNLSDYYDVSLKEARLRILREHAGFTFHKLDLADQAAVAGIFAQHKPDYVVNLAAQAGVRYSLVNPRAYIDSNITGFLHILEGCRHHGVKHLVFASSSSVYGLNTTMPFSVHHNVDHPVSLYAATKKANELMAHSYSHLYGLPTTGLRFFTVYGPWGRPDMALFLFTKAILEGKPIDVYNEGRMKRDFTYVDDIIEGVVRLIPRPAAPNPDWRGDRPDAATSPAPYRLYNIGNHSPVQLLRFIEVIEECLGKKAIKRMLPLQAGDVPASFADVADLTQAVGFTPNTPIETGVRRFIEWYQTYFRP